MENAIIQRLNTYFKQKGLTKRKVAALLGMHEMTLNGKLNGSRSLDLQTLCNIVTRFDDLSLEWLLKGETMLRKPSDGAPSDSVLSERIRSLEALVAEKDERIKELKMLVELLRK